MIFPDGFYSQVYIPIFLNYKTVSCVALVHLGIDFFAPMARNSSPEQPAGVLLHV
jgi:hypothetical protein